MTDHRFQIREGQPVPSVDFKVLRDGLQTRRSEDIFTGRTVIVCALPGAYTPTCSRSLSDSGLIYCAGGMAAHVRTRFSMNQ